MASASTQAEPQALFDESFAECEIFCRFYIHISKSFGLSAVRNDVPAVLAAELTREYIGWANPPTPQHKLSVKIPEVPRSELEETHRYILKWSESFLASQLEDRITRQSDLPLEGPVPEGSFVPPTHHETIRAARALYQLFLCLIYCQFNIVDPNEEYGYDDEMVTDNADLEDALTYAIVETFDYVDLTIIHELLLDYMGGVTRPVISRIRNRALPDVPPSTLISHVYNAEWYMMAALGPRGLWEFIFESSLEQQRGACATDVGNGFVYPRSFIREARNTTKFRNTYLPLVRICKDELIIGVGDSNWWGCSSTQVPIVDKTVVIWDDWRLKEWGYTFPMIKLPLYQPGQTPFHPFDCELSTPIIPFKECSKKYAFTQNLFPEVAKLEGPAPGTTGLTSDEPLRVGDVLGKSIPVLPTLTHPIETFLPPEIQSLILELADYSQYPTLRAVCRSWKAETWRLLKNRYRDPFSLSEMRFEDGFPYLGQRLVPASPSEFPFLIHSALIGFTGYVRGKLNYSSYTPIVEFGRIYSKPEPDDPIILSSTEELRAAADYPFIIPNTENPGPLTHSLYGKVNAGRVRYHNYHDRIAFGGMTLPLSKIMTVKAFLGSHFSRSGHHPKLRLLPLDGQPVERFLVQVARVVESGSVDHTHGCIGITLQDPAILRTSRSPSWSP
ncbi:hypothetical protein TWF481_007579 [Arthrobotrys musiformis]|uniref:F-box domain-containing protein n=1 Tax=Arthrobotrys musiformis TaxID=47236 RepID=A0AAV9WDU4_9PEZI